MTKAQHIVTALLLATTACSNASDISGAYERGIAALEAGQPRTARVEFMNAIKADHDNGAARVMQARTYLALGDAIAAAAEIERARQPSIPASDNSHLMAPALPLQQIGRASRRGRGRRYVVNSVVTVTFEKILDINDTRARVKTKKK